MMKKTIHLGQPVRGVQTVDVGVIPPEQRVTTSREHDGGEGVSGGQGAGGVAQHQVAGLLLLQLGQHLLHPLADPEHLHLQRLLQDVAEYCPTGLG